MSHSSASSADDSARKAHGTAAPLAVGMVVPCYNDARRLARYLPGLCAAVAELPLRLEIQIVDDGSAAAADRAELERIAGELRPAFPGVRPVLFQNGNQGKGAAIRRGWEALEGVDWYGFVDADGAIPAREVARLLAQLPSAAPHSLFASRIRMKGRTVERSRKRHLAGRLFATLVGELIDPGIYDSQCGFKLIPSYAWHRIRGWMRERRFAFDVELLAALNHAGCPILEVPIDWSDIPGSKVSLFSDSLQMFLAVRAIRARFALIAGEPAGTPCSTDKLC